MLTDAKGNTVTPSEGHSISTALTPNLPPQEGGIPGSTSPEGSLPAKSPFQRFLERSNAQKYAMTKSESRERIIAGVMKRLEKLDAYWQDDEAIFEKLQDAKLRDLTLAEGVFIDKLQTLMGQPTQVISVKQQDKLDEILPVLMQTIKERGLDITARERTIEVKA